MPPTYSAAPPIKLTRGVNLSHRLVNELVTEIQAGALRPGDRLPTEPALEQRFGVSRTVVREAISRLQSLGMVATRHGVGTFVLEPPSKDSLLPPSPTDLTVRDLLAMLELRISIETEAAGIAAMRRTPEQLDALQKTLDWYLELQRIGSETAQADFQFHLQIANATGNHYFVEVMRNLSQATIQHEHLRVQPNDLIHERPLQQNHLFGGTSLPQLRSNKQLTAQEHQNILDTIQRGDPAAARAAMLMHLSNSRARLQRLLELRDSPASA